jgi:glycosyltransferase involved in cell wall biosynthesis
VSHAVTSSELPRLLYLGDVPVEASYHGSALLYRLLQTYPSDRLQIIEAGIEVSKVERRLPDVSYYAALMPMRRLQTTRFADWYATFCLRAAGLRRIRLEDLAHACRPEVIITVTNGCSWLTAAQIARRCSVPLQLVCHDEWARVGMMQNWKDRIFGEHYRAAVSRFCVSPFMAREYAQRYGVDSVVLYPSRSVDAACYIEPPHRLRTNTTNKLTCAFAGTINSIGVVSALQRLARSLESLNGRLLIYGPLSMEIAIANRLHAANIELAGPFPAKRLMHALRERADVLFVPMSFNAEDHINMQMSFPSKLADYSGVGLPLLIYGPPNCSAARWAAENHGVAEVVTEESEAALIAALRRLASDPSHRISLAQKALTVGETMFSHRAASALFYKALVDTNTLKR